MNGTAKTMLLAILSCGALLALVSCQTVKQISTTKTDGLFTEVVKGQTEIAEYGKQISDTADVIDKTVTDIASSGTVTEEQIKTLVVYTDKNTGLVAQVKTMNEKINQQSLVIDQTSKSRLSDNASFSTIIAHEKQRYEAEKIKSSKRLVCALIATGIALILAVVLLLPKLLKAIL